MLNIRMIQKLVLLGALCTGLAACSQMATDDSAPGMLVSAQSPASVAAMSPIPESRNSLPVGAEGLGGSPFESSPDIGITYHQ